MNLLNNLKYRYEVAKKFTENYREQTKNLVKEYKAEGLNDTEASLFKVDYVEMQRNRYRIITPLIFTYHEAMMASMFDRIPDLIFTARGEDDEEKRNKIEAAYQYLTDKLRMEWFLNDAAWWFILTGFTTAHAIYKQEVEGVPVIDDMTGEPLLDEAGEPVVREVLAYDDPVLEVGDPLKENFSPESQFSVTGDRVPYYFREELMDPYEIQQTYDVWCEPDAKVEHADNPGKKYEHSKQFDRVKVMFYYGDIPFENRSEVEDWDLNAEYYCVLTGKKLLYAERVEQKNCRMLKWYGAPNEFFGFGLGKLLKPYQHEKSVRRSQQIRYGDVAAYPKLAVDDTTDVDEKALVDPRENVILTYSDKKPEYLQAPDISSIVFQNDQNADADAQKAAGLLDLSTGSQTAATVDTATGQTIFAEAAERRVRLAKKKFTNFYKEVVIMVLKLAQKHWTEEKLVSLTDDDGNSQVISVSADDLADIDFDTDIDINAETLTINKDVLRQQAIELYSVTKDDPLVDRRAVFTDMIRKGFNIQNPERYVKEMQIEPGTPVMDADGNMYIVDETGELVPQEQINELAPAGGQDVSSSPSGIMGATQNI